MEDGKKKVQKKDGSRVDLFYNVVGVANRYEQARSKLVKMGDSSSPGVVGFQLPWKVCCLLQNK